MATLSHAVPDNVRLRLVKTDLSGRGNLFDRDRYDVIIIDGLYRMRCAELSLDRVSDDGRIVVDNSDGFRGSEGTYPIMDLFRGAGFVRIDFYGYVSGMINPDCTSVFFRGRSFVLAGESPPNMNSMRSFDR